MNPYKARFAGRHRRCGRSPTRCRAPTCSSASPPRDLLTPEMLRSMAKDPIVFAMANPDPGDHLGARRSRRARTSSWRPAAPTIPNQVNNVLGFPFIFRGALDVRASDDQRGDEDGRGAARSPQLAREDVPEPVLKAYGLSQPAVRPRVPHPEAVRSARAAVGGAGGGQGRDGDGRRAQADRRPRARTASRSSGSWARRARSCT